MLSTVLLLAIKLNDPSTKLLLSVAGIVIILVIAKQKWGMSLKEDLLLTPPRLPAALVWVVAAIAWILLSDFMIHWRGPWDLSKWHQQPLYLSIMEVAAIGIAGPILEELIFRGILLHKATKQWHLNPWMAVILIAAIWAAIHYSYSLPVIAVIFVEGILLGAATLKTRSLYVPILMHICWNLYAVW